MSNTKAMPSVVGGRDVESVRLGTGAYAWKVSPSHVDLSMPAKEPLPATISAEPQNITIDLARSAMIVVDMQNDFCAPGGWVDWLGADLSPERAPIKPLQAILPALRANGVPIIWLNWGNRPDCKNLPPTILYVFNMYSTRTATASASAASYPGTARIFWRRTVGRRLWSMNSNNCLKTSKSTSSASAVFGTRRSTASCAISR